MPARRQGRRPPRRRNALPDQAEHDARHQPPSPAPRCTPRTQSRADREERGRRPALSRCLRQNRNRSRTTGTRRAAPSAAAKRKAGIDDGVDQPSDRDDRAAADAVGPAAASQGDASPSRRGAPPTSAGRTRALPATSVSFSSRNASVELPSVNNVSTSMNAVNSRDSGVEVRLTDCGSAKAASRTLALKSNLPVSGIRKISATAIAPGMIVSAKSVR